MDEWQNRTKEHNSDGAVIGVKEHKTSARQVASFLLSAEEESVSSSNSLFFIFQNKQNSFHGFIHVCPLPTVVLCIL